jgi:uncharacterized membrane protein
MADRPVFLYAAIYDEIADAEADYEAVFDLHAAGAIGTFDSAVIRKDDDGKVRVTKTEKPTQHGAWTGAGALVGLLFPPAIIGSAIGGATAGGLIGHLERGIPRDDLKELGGELERGSAAVIVLGESKIEEQLERATKRANKLIEKQIDADAEELKREIKGGGAGGRHELTWGALVRDAPPEVQREVFEPSTYRSATTSRTAGSRSLRLSPRPSPTLWRTPRPSGRRASTS